MILSLHLLAASDTCKTLPAKTCWANPKGKIDSVTTSDDPNDCCVACTAAAQCLTWNHGDHSSSGWKCASTADRTWDLHS